MAAVTWNPSDKDTTVTLSNGNLDATGGAGGQFNDVRATQGYSTGAFYFEVATVVVGSGNNGLYGIADTTTAFGSSNTFVGNFANSIGCRFDFQQGNGFTVDVATSFGGSASNTNVYMIAVDITNKKIWRGLNGTWLGSVTPVVGASTQWAHWTGALTVFPAGSPYSVEDARIKPTTASFSFSAPSGFSPWDPGSSTVFRRSLSPIGTRTGTRQSI